MTATSTSRQPGPPDPAHPTRGRVAPRVFFPAAAVILLFVLTAWLFTDSTISVVETLHEGVVASFGWYYVVLVAAFVIFVIVLGVSRLGDVQLGRDGEQPEFRLWSWLAMLFAAGMGIGLVFWGVAEPLSHLVEPRPGTTGATAAGSTGADPWYGADGQAGAAAEAGQTAMVQSFLHWGVHPWAIYVIVGLAIAYAAHRKGRPISIRWALEPVLGRLVRGWVGDLIDVVAIVGTLFGVATSLGLGALQIAAGMGFVWGVDPGTFVQVMLIIGITAVATLSVVTGVHRGIKWLSHVNVSLMLLLLLFVLVAGPTLYLLRGFVQSTGQYVHNLVQLSFDVGAQQGEAGQQWAATWTTFYWGWWMSWAPFVGIFIARISRGRTVRELVAAMLVPVLGSFLWFAVLGGAGIHRELLGSGGLAGTLADGEEFALFGLLDGFPAGTLVTVGVLLLIGVFFVTSSDSGSLVVDMLASGGDPDPPTWSRVFWALTEGAVAVALLVLAAGEAGLTALQTAAIMAALPVSIIMILMCVAIWRQLRAEHRARVQAARRRRTQEITDHVSRHMIRHGLVNGGPRAGSPEPQPSRRPE